jgi:hypothetical protein
MPSDKTTKVTKTTSPKEKEVDNEKHVHNKATTAAGLRFNVNDTKRWIKKQFKLDDKYYIVDQKDEETIKKYPNISNGHIGLTAAVEAMNNSIIKSIVDRLPKEKSGLYSCNRATIINSIQLDNNLNPFFQKFLSAFDSDVDYTAQLWISKKDISEYIDTVYSKNIMLDNTAYNLISYLLLRFAVVLVSTGFNLMSYANKKSIDYKSILYAVNIHLSDEVANYIIMRVEDAVGKSGDKDKKDDEDEDEEDSEDDEPKKKTDKTVKVSSKNNKSKTSAANNSDSESDEESDDDVESSEEEEEEKPKKGSKPAAKKATK